MFIPIKVNVNANKRWTIPKGLTESLPAGAPTAMMNEAELKAVQLQSIRQHP